MRKPTVEEARQWRWLSNSSHYNGGSEWFGYGHACVDEPRLQILDKYVRATRQGTRTFFVDGARAYPTLEEAVAGLAEMPTITSEEAELLASIPLEWGKHVGPRAPVAALGRRGLAELRRDGDQWEVRRTELSAEVLESLKVR